MMMKLRHIPNILTLFRFLLVGPVLWAILNEHYSLAFYCFVLAGLTDALDGLLARVYGWTSRFGSIADPLADKILLMSSFIALGWVTQIPPWLVALVVFRDIWIMSGGMAYRFVIGKFDFSPSAISKLNTFLQITLVIVVLVNLSVLPLPIWLVNCVVGAASITTGISMLHYTWVWGMRALHNYRLKNTMLMSNLRGQKI